MNISAPFITRPIATSLLMLALLVFGVLSYFKLPVSPLPDVDFSYHPSIGKLAGSKRRDHRCLGGNTARERILGYRWPRLDELAELPRNH